MDQVPRFFDDKTPPPELYQYTSVDGLRGMVQGKTIWATNINYLNDTEEYRHGERLINERLKRRRKSRKNPASKHFFELLEGTSKWFSDDDVFVASLSERGDLLSQWRGYTPNGAGYCMGFASGALEKIAWNNARLQLLRCRYDREDQIASVDKLIDDTLRQWSESWKPHGEQGSFVNLGLIYAFNIYRLFLAGAMKHPTFSEEKEWRLLGVQRGHDQIKFRPGRSFLVPYIELDWKGPGDRSPLSSVRLGPCPHPVLARKSLQKFLEVSGADHVSVEETEIPFRSW